MPSLKKKIKKKLLQLPAKLDRKTSRSPSANHNALPETSTAGIPDVAPSPEDNQPSHPTPSVENTRSTPSHPSESSAHRPSEPEPRPSARIREGLSTAWIALKAALRLLEKNADALPPLKIAVSGLVTVLDFQEAFTENCEEYEKLATELTNIVNILTPHVPALVERGVSSSVVRIVESISAELTHIKQQQDRNTAMRIIATNEDKGDVLKRYRTIESLFRQLQSDITFRTWDDIRKGTEATLLEKMDPVYDALYNSSYSTTIKRGGCTTQTREEVLEQLKNWARDLGGAKIYWMNGMAGTGKTTISYTLCEWLEKNNYLGANFFCSRASDLCRNADKILPTLAYQLAHYSDSFRSMLCKVLEKEPGACRRAVKVQFQNLIQTPLQAIKTAISGNVVVLIDALDECEGGDSFLTTLLELAGDLPIKFFIASRPEASIYDQILASSYSDSILYLHNIDASTDIRTYLIKELESMSPSPDEVKRLAEASGRLFIYAATAVRYIFSGKPGAGRRTRLRTVLGMGNAPESIELQYRDLDKLYTTILDAAVNRDHYESHEIDNTLLILRTVVCAKEPMTIQTLVSLLSPMMVEPEEEVEISLRLLQSVLQIEDVEKPIVPFHASFPDFLFDKRRSKDFHCERAMHNGVLANRCFDLMKKELRFNICDLKSSFLLDHNVPDLPEQIKNSISPALSYACQHWDEHLLEGSLSNTVHKQLVDFLTFRFLFWVEVLSLTEHITEHVHTLGKIVVRLKVSEHTRNIGFQTEIKAKDEANYSDTTKQLVDANEFLTNCKDWSCSTPHIYISNLTFCSRTSSVYKNYCRHTQRLAGEAIKFITAASITKGAEITSVSEKNIINVWDPQNGNMVVIAGSFGGHTDRVQSVTFSLDGTRIVSGSDDYTVRVWNAHNGNMVAGPFNGHTGPVQSVAFSPDGTRIASGSDDYTTRVWDAHNGDMVAGPFNGHTGPVESVTFSPDGTQIASGSRDHTIRVWDAHNGNMVAGPFHGHTSVVRSVAFSHDGARIASGSWDDTIRVWDTHSGNTVAGPFHGHTGPVQSLAFSPDGTRIASGSQDCTIRVWDACNGNMVAGPFHGHTDPVQSVSFSPDGTRIVSGSDDHNIRVWNVHNGNMVAGPFNYHTQDSILSVAFSPDGTRIASGSANNTIGVLNAYTGADVHNQNNDQVESVAFSPDSTRIVSGSRDGAIRVWDAHNGNMIAGPFHGHTGEVWSVAFSPDGTRIVSGSDDCTIRVWDAHNGNMVAGPFNGHTGSVQSVAFSPDGTRIVSGSEDHTIRVWDAHNGNMVAGRFRGHTDWVQSVAFSPDGTRIASGSWDSTIRVWDAHNGDMIAGPFHGHTNWVWSVAFSSDGTRIVSGSKDCTIQVWDAHNGDIVAGPFNGHYHGVQSVAFSPDGTQIVSGSDDCSICVWDAHNGKIIVGPFNGHTSRVESVAFSPDGTRIVSGSRDCTIRVWDAHIGLLNPDCIVLSLFSGNEPGNLPVKQFTLEEHQWITADNNLLFKVPHPIPTMLPYAGQILVITLRGGFSSTSVAVDLSKLFIGERWSQAFYN